MNLKVLLMTSEAGPYAKTGGLGDVMEILPKELRKQNVDARVVFPKYKNLSKFNSLTDLGRVSVGIGFRHHEGQILRVDEEENHNYVIANDHFFGRDNLYGYEDDHKRFYFFVRAALEFLKLINFKPHVIHLNDWQVGLTSFHLEEFLYDDPFYADIATLFSIHNIQHQGNFHRGILPELDISDYYFTPDKLELHGNVSYMKSAIVYSHAISTVSAKYAKEIQTPTYSYGLDGVIAARKRDLYGIINGISYEDVDKGIMKDRDYIQNRVHLPEHNVPVIALISRLVQQKGIDIIAVALDEILSMDLQLVVLGTGELRYEELFREYSRRYPDKLAAHIYFSTDLSIDIYKHSDMFLMPSLFEPCGLSQMIAMKYGTIPIVRKTGGLEDTVQHFNPKTKEGNGFVFEDYDANGLMWALREAMSIYQDGVMWGAVAKNALASKFTVEASATKYIEVYNKIKKT